ncbi:MAG: hypothetical protein ACOCXV_01170 [Bacteroidota bacterium]
MITTENGTKATAAAPDVLVEQQVAPSFKEGHEYTFSMRSFRYRNQWAFCTVTYNNTTMEILIGTAVDYPLPAMLQAKQFGGNVYGTFKGSHNHNGVEYPRFWNVSVG